MPYAASTSGAEEPHEVEVASLPDLVDDPFVRHHVDPRVARRAWVLDRAALVDTGRHLPGAEGPSFLLLGPRDPLARLAAAVAAVEPPPWRVTVPSDAPDVLPPAWQQRHRRLWHWMLSTTAPPPAEREGTEVVEVPDAVGVDDLLDAANPDAHARPGSPGIECWLGVRDGSTGRLAAVGALVRQHDGTGHLRAVTVRPELRGRGLGRGLSAELTRRAQHGAGVATLGVYADNDPAVAIYTGLGYSVVHTFASGPVSGFSRTTAVAPSR